MTLTLYSMAHAYREVGDLNTAMARFEQALKHCQASGDQLMLSRLYHALANQLWDTGHKEAALAKMQNALTISQEIGYGPGIAHGLMSLCHFQASLENIEAANAYLHEAIKWLGLIEDQQGLAEAQALKVTVEMGELNKLKPYSKMSPVKSHLNLPEGKVYCAFESPISRESACPI